MEPDIDGLMRGHAPATNKNMSVISSKENNVGHTLATDRLGDVTETLTSRITGYRVAVQVLFKHVEQYLKSNLGNCDLELIR